MLRLTGPQVVNGGFSRPLQSSCVLILCSMFNKSVINKSFWLAVVQEPELCLDWSVFTLKCSQQPLGIFNLC